jgi:hypothetical protein
MDADPDADPDPAIFIIGLQKTTNFFKDIFLPNTF